MSALSVKTGRPSKAGPDFTESQPWVKTAPNLVFLDGTEQLDSSSDHNEPQPTSALSSTASHAIPRSVPHDAMSDYNAREDEQSSPTRSVHHRPNSTGHMELPMFRPPETPQGLLNYSQAAVTSPTSVNPYQSPSATWTFSPGSQWPTTSTNGLADPPTDVPTASDLLVDFLSANSRSDVLEATTSHANYTAAITSPGSASGIYLDASVFPLSEKEEAALLRYYIKRLARDFDLSDPQANFRLVVPQRAATCPLLLNAIYALSARHLSRIGDYDPLISDKYHQECLKHVIPVLNDSAAILDETLLASTIILRHLEEIGVPLSGGSPSDDRQSHLLGSHAFIKAQRHAVEVEGLRQAAFWVGLRQEIYVAFVNQRAIAIDLNGLNLDRSFEPAADHVWSCRMVVLCADVICYCFGEADTSTRTYERLTKSVQEWHRCKNESFTPIYSQEADDESIFPEVWFPKDDVIIGWQHYYIAKLLLAAHDPKVPRLGPRRAAALRAIDDEIKDYVRILCGIAMSNSDLSPNFVYASMSIVAAGDKFVERHEQEALLHVLNLCDSQYAIHTGHTKENLKAAWDWPRDND